MVLSENVRFMSSLLPEVRTSHGETEVFDSKKLITSIVSETGLPSETATDVVKNVLRRIIQEDGGWISRRRIREICGATLEAAGLTEAYKFYSQSVTNKKIKVIRKVVDDYLSNGFYQNDNANMVRHVSGLFNWVTQYNMKKHAMAVYSELAPEAVRLHERGALHIHDLWTSVYCAYCSGFDMKKIIHEGLFLAKRAGPAHRFDSVLNQLINFIVSIQQEFAGAVAFSSFDTLLAPFIKKQKISYKKVRHEIQSLFFNLNQPSRYGFQSPFVNFNVDIVVPKHLQGQVPLIGGELASFTYDDCKAEMDMINRAICEMHLKGDFDDAPFTFPIITVQIGNNFDWDDPVRYEYIKLASLRGQPYWLNYNVDYLDEDMNLSMCCRLKIDYNELMYHTGGIFAPGDATGSIGVVSLNMPRVGYEATSEEQFYEKLDVLLDAARTQLIAKRILVNKSLDKELLPTTDHHLPRGFDFHFNTIGIVGMHDCCMNYLHQPIWEPSAQQFVVKVLRYINERLGEFQVADQMLYNLEQCYDDETEILTRGGFKLFKDLTYDDDVMTYNQHTDRLEYQKPTKIVEFDHDGVIYHLKSKFVDLRVTEEHNVFVETDRGVKKFKKPYELNTHDKIPKVSLYDGEYEEYFVLPSVENVTRKTEDVKILMTDWLEFFGLWIADGHVEGSNGGKVTSYEVSIGQKKKRELYKRVLNKLPFKYNENGAHLRMSNKQLWQYLSPLGNSLTKRIPERIKNLDPEQLEHLLEYLMEGDGHVRESGRRTYYTISKQLADDVQEIFLKVGKYGSITTREPRSHFVESINKTITGKHLSYAINEVKRPNNHIDPKKHIIKEHYKGKTYCCEVPNHVLVVRRNYKIAFCGNTPAERTASRLAYYDYKKYKNIYISVKEGDVVEYTNSTHLPVDHDSIFDKIEIEGKFQREFTGGSVTHLFLDEISNVEGLSKFAQNICENSELGYFSFTPTLSNCTACQKTIVGNFPICPTCKAETSVLSRIVGYYRPVSQWNPAKKLEFDLRRQFKVR